MARPNVTDNPVYVECARMLEPLDRMLLDAKAEANRIVEVAKMRVKAERLAAVKWGVDNGLSQYAISRLTGVTSANYLKALIEEAMGSDYVPAAGAIQMPQPLPNVSREADGWTLTLTGLERGELWKATWLAVDPDGTNIVMVSRKSEVDNFILASTVDPVLQPVAAVAPDWLWDVLTLWRPDSDTAM